ncbi:hypothetical protein Bca52824_077485 [Brassica carinata]|uniref:Uncharacterized protein n=1 Tax=Brassica carinata TaxID=52824 RepID=A0A8X7PU45_BRACI|nr:hypothetical protein Bca52824_077485 [Brassica carinata]
MRVYRSSRKGVTYPSPRSRYATRLIGSLLYGQPQPISHAMGVVPPVPRCEAFATGIWKLYIPTARLQHGSGAGRNLAGYRVTKSKSNACGFGAVITGSLDMWV